MTCRPAGFRPEYDLIRTRVGAALGLDASHVTVTPQSASAAPRARPEPS